MTRKSEWRDREPSRLRGAYDSRPKILDRWEQPAASRSHRAIAPGTGTAQGRRQLGPQAAVVAYGSRAPPSGSDRKGNYRPVSQPELQALTSGATNGP